jgi:hypothetical protein
VEADHAEMNPSVGKVEAFGLLAGDVWAPEHPSVLYNRFFNMAGSNPYLADDVARGEVEIDHIDGSLEWSHLNDIIDDLLEEEDSDGDGAVVVEGFADQDHGHSADENPVDSADDDKVTREESPGTTAATAAPVGVSPSEDCAPVTTVGTRRRSSSSTQRRGKQQNAPSLSSGAGNGVSCSTSKLDTARADGRKGLAGDVGRRTAAAAAAAAAPSRRSMARSAKGSRKGGSGRSGFAPES